MSVLPAARRPLCPFPDRLYFVRSALGSAWIVVGPDDRVRAADRLVAGWTLRRHLASVVAAAARRGASVEAAALPEAVPA